MGGFLTAFATGAFKGANKQEDAKRKAKADLDKQRFQLLQRVLPVYAKAQIDELKANRERNDQVDATATLLGGDRRLADAAVRAKVTDPKLLSSFKPNRAPDEVDIPDMPWQTNQPAAPSQTMAPVAQTNTGARPAAPPMPGMPTAAPRPVSGAPQGAPGTYSYAGKPEDAQDLNKGWWQTEIDNQMGKLFGGEPVKGMNGETTWKFEEKYRPQALLASTNANMLYQMGVEKQEASKLPRPVFSPMEAANVALFIGGHTADQPTTAKFRQKMKDNFDIISQVLPDGHNVVERMIPAWAADVQRLADPADPNYPLKQKAYIDEIAKNFNLNQAQKIAFRNAVLAGQAKK